MEYLSISYHTHCIIFVGVLFSSWRTIFSQSTLKGLLFVKFIHRIQKLFLRLCKVCWLKISNTPFQIPNTLQYWFMLFVTSQFWLWCNYRCCWISSLLRKSGSETIWLEAANRKDLRVCFLWTPQIGHLRQFMVNSGEMVSPTKSLERDKKLGVDISSLKGF